MGDEGMSAAELAELLFRAEAECDRLRAENHDLRQQQRGVTEADVRREIDASLRLWLGDALVGVGRHVDGGARAVVYITTWTALAEALSRTNQTRLPGRIEERTLTLLVVGPVTPELRKLCAAGGEPAEDQLHRLAAFNPWSPWSDDGKPRGIGEPA